MDDAVAVRGPPADKEVLWLDVPVHDVFGVHVLDAGDELDGKHAHGLEREPPRAHVEEILQRRAKELKHQSIVFPTRTIVEDRRDPH